MVIQNIEDDFLAVQQAIEQGPIYPSVAAEEIRSYLHSHYDFTGTRELPELIADVEEMMQKWQVQVTHPRYFGLFNPGVTLASVIADTLVAMYNPQLANWRTSPAANEIERHTLAWLAEKFGLPPESIATFTSGGSEANLSAVIVALTKTFPGYGEHGIRHLGGAPTIYLSEEAHNGYRKIAHTAGLGRNAVRLVATDSSLKLDPADLRRRVAEDRAQGLSPFLVVGTAGTTATGVIDPLVEIGSACRDLKLWFHVDAAWGGASILSPELRHHLAGIETADSITCDAHKWFSVPMGAGMFFCRHPAAVSEAFRADLTYLPEGSRGPTFDPLTTSMQWSRRFMGLKLFLALAQRGASGYAEMIEHQTRLGGVFRELLISSGWRILNSTPLPLICFTRDRLDTSRLLSALREHQVAWMTEVRCGGLPSMRACITNFRTTREDVELVVREMNRLAPSSLMAA